jgi:hypothetical protein
MKSGDDQYQYGWSAPRGAKNSFEARRETRSRSNNAISFRYCLRNVVKRDLRLFLGLETRSILPHRCKCGHTMIWWRYGAAIPHLLKLVRTPGLGNAGLISTSSRYKINRKSEIVPRIFDEALSSSSTLSGNKYLWSQYVAQFSSVNNCSSSHPVKMNEKNRERQTCGQV